MSPAPATAIAVGALEARVEMLDDQTSSLRRDGRELRDELGKLRVEMALSRQSTDALVQTLAALDRRLEQMESQRSSDTKAELERRSLPARGAVVVAVVVCVLAVAGGWIGRQLPDLPRVPVAQAQPVR